MFHYLTAGYIDETAVSAGKVVVLAPLNEAVLSQLVNQYRDQTTSDEITFEGKPIRIKEGYVRCPWYTPFVNRTSLKFILALHGATNCLIADVEHGRMVTPEVLLTSLRRN